MVNMDQEAYEKELKEIRKERREEYEAEWDAYMSSDVDDDDFDEGEEDDFDYDDEETKPKNYSDYIVSLEDHAPHSGEDDALTRQEWRDWIKYEAQVHDEEIDDDDVERIVRVLEDDGYVKEG